MIGFGEGEKGNEKVMQGVFIYNVYYYYYFYYSMMNHASICLPQRYVRDSTLFLPLPTLAEILDQVHQGD